MDVVFIEGTTTGVWTLDDVLLSPLIVTKQIYKYILKFRADHIDACGTIVV